MRKRNILLGGAIATLGLLVLASCGKKDDKKETKTSETTTSEAGNTVLSYAEYMAAQDGDIVTIEAYIAARYK